MRADGCGCWEGDRLPVAKAGDKLPIADSSLAECLFGDPMTSAEGFNLGQKGCCVVHDQHHNRQLPITSIGNPGIASPNDSPHIGFMKADWREKLIEVLEAKGLDKKNASVGAGLEPGAVYDISRGRDPGFTKMVKLAEAHGFSLDSLTGKPQIEARRTGGIPVKGQVAAGVWHELETPDVEPFEPLPVALDLRFPAEAQYGLVVRGNSINRFASAGDVLVCLDLGMTGLQIADDDMVVIERTREQAGLREVTAKRVRFVEGGMELWPDSDDPAFQTPLLIHHGNAKTDDDGIRIIARVEWAFKSPRHRR